MKIGIDIDNVLSNFNDVLLNDYLEHDKTLNNAGIVHKDEYIRKMRITGIISLRGNGRFLDFNSLESEKIEYLLSHYGEPVNIEDKKKYYEYLSVCDNNLLKIKEKSVEDVNLKQRVLLQFAQIYTDEKLQKELVQTYKGESRDELLKFIEAPTRLEFLTSIALVKHFPEIRVLPNYSIDDEGLPKFTAGAGKADIECENDEIKGIVEVTLMTGAAQQTEHEVSSIDDHLRKIEANTSKFTLAIFVAPIIRERAIRFLEFLNFTYHKDKTQGGVASILISELIKKFSIINSFKDLVN